MLGQGVAGGYGMRLESAGVEGEPGVVLLPCPGLEGRAQPSQASGVVFLKDKTTVTCCIEVELQQPVFIRGGSKDPFVLHCRQQG